MSNQEPEFDDQQWFSGWLAWPLIIAGAIVAPFKWIWRTVRGSR
jgi:hypothetical protein